MKDRFAAGLKGSGYGAARQPFSRSNAKNFHGDYGAGAVFCAAAATARARASTSVVCALTLVWAP